MTFEEIKELLQANGFDRETWDGDMSVLDHCLQVAETAGAIARLIARRGYPIDVEDCEIGGLLHDFALPVRANALAVKQVQRRLELGGPRVLAQQLRSGELELRPEEVIKGTLPVPHKFVTPVTIEEKVIAFADWIHHPRPTRFPTQSPVWNHLLTSFGPLGTTEQELSRLSGLASLWEAFTSRRILHDLGKE